MRDPPTRRAPGSPAGWSFAIACLFSMACSVQSERSATGLAGRGPSSAIQSGSAVERPATKQELITEGVLSGEIGTVETEGSTCLAKRTEGTTEISGSLGPRPNAEAGLALGLDAGFGNWGARSRLSFSVRRRVGPSMLTVRAISSKVEPDADGSFDTATTLLGRTEVPTGWRTVELEIPEELRTKEREVSEIDFVITGSGASFAFDIRDPRTR